VKNHRSSPSNLQLVEVSKNHPRYIQIQFIYVLLSHVIQATDSKHFYHTANTKLLQQNYLSTTTANPVALPDEPPSAVRLLLSAGFFPFSMIE
jgi:hypothetical protein